MKICMGLVVGGFLLSLTLTATAQPPAASNAGTGQSSSDHKLFVEPSRVIHEWVGENAGDQFGWTARKVGDLDGDQVIDFVATAPTHGGGAGKIYVYSSKTGQLLFSRSGKAGQQFGNSAVAIGDVDGDGVSDLAVGAPTPRGIGSVTVCSGKDGAVLKVIPGSKTGAQFGYEVSSVGDLNQDQVPDFLVGAAGGDGRVKSAGTATLFCGKTFEPLLVLGGQRAGDAFGNAAAAAAIDDGWLLAIGAKDAGENKRGRVYVYQLTADPEQPSAKLKFKIEGDRQSVNLGQMFIAFPGDLDRDGTPDVYASDFSDRTRAPGGGKVVVHSGATGKELLAIYGEQPGEGLGTSPSDAGDVDGDGIGDLVIGAWQNRQGAQSGGKVYLYSCAGEGKLLKTWTCTAAGDTLGFDACGIGDVDGDGRIDFLLTSAWSGVQGVKSGRVLIVAGEDYPETGAKPK